MTNENTKKKGIGWFKSSNYGQNQLDEENIDKQADVAKIMKEEQLITMEESDEKGLQNTNTLFSKDSQDKVVLDSIVSLENMIKDRQLLLYKNKDIDNQLFSANETISRTKQDLMKKEQILLEKNKEIRGLETNLTNKQMGYDQLLEDYKEYQNTSNTEYGNISIQLDTEINKYNKLNEELISYQYQSMLKINELEEKVRILTIENQQFEQQYRKVVDEKADLMKTINDFTDRMSFSLSPKATTDSR